MSKQSRLIKNTLILLVGIIGSKFINFIMLPFLTSWLSVDEYGTIDIFFTLTSMIVPLCTLQLEQGVFRFLIDDKTEEEQKKTITTGFIGLIVIMTICDIFALSFLSVTQNILYKLYLATINLQAIYVMLQQIVRGKEENYVYTINSILFAFGTVGFVVIFVHKLGMGVYGYIIGYILSNIFSIMFMFHKSKFWELVVPSFFSILKLKELLKYSIPMILNNVSWWILNTSDKLVLKYFIGTTANGIYAASGKIPGLISSLYSVFQMAWQESASREQNAEDLNEFYSNVFRVLFAVMSYGVVFILLANRFLFLVLINNKFIDAYNHIPILLLGLFFFCIAQFYGGIYVGMHKSGKLGWTSSIAAIINILVNLCLIQKWFIYAASISTLTSYFVLFLVRYITVKKMIKIKYNFTENIISFLCLAISFFLTYLKTSLISLVFLGIISIMYLVLYKDLVVKMLRVLNKKIKSNVQSGN